MRLCQIGWWRRGVSFLVLALALAVNYHSIMAEDTSPAPKRDINAVLAAHDKELLAIPGVVGVYVGTLADGRTLCLKVMLARKNSESERRIPRTIEGYPVTIEVTGEARAMETP
jgi:hypothetical protein